MATGIIGLVGALVGLWVWWVKNRSKVIDDVYEQHMRRTAEVERMVAKGDANGIARWRAEQLERLRADRGEAAGKQSDSGAGDKGPGADGAV